MIETRLKRFYSRFQIALNQSSIWDWLARVGSSASIIGIVIILVGKQARVQILALVALFGLVAAMYASYKSQQIGMVPVKRKAMVDTGRRLVGGVKRRAVMFSGDASWAEDYQDVIREAVSDGKRIEVITHKQDTQAYQDNIRILENAGAEIYELEDDTNLRAMLVDPYEPVDAVLYVANRRRKESGRTVTVGEPGTNRDFQYEAKIYDHNTAPKFLIAIRRMYEMITQNGE